KNLKILTGVTAQLDANTQLQARAQQDKSFAESMLSQQLAAWNSYRAAPNLPPLRQRLTVLQNQLIDQKSRYTEDHPDVMKTERDIADIKARLKEANGQKDDPDQELENKAKTEPPEVLRLREQIHQYEGVIERSGREQKRLQQLVNVYQGHLALSPDIE